MKVKILEALKTKYSNLGLDDKAFDGVADFALTTVTEESQIQTFVDNAGSMLKSFQSFADRRVTKFEQENSDLKKKLEEKKEPTTTPPADMPEWAKAMQESMKAMVDSQARKEQESSLAIKKASIRQGMIAKGVDEKLCDKLIPTLPITIDSNIDDVVAAGVASFNEFKSAFGGEAGKPTVPNGNSEDENKSFFERKKAESETLKQLNNDA